MKKTVKKSISIILSLAIIIGGLCTLVACNKDKDNKITLSDVYTSNSSYDEFSSFDTAVVLPANWSVYTTSITSSSTASADANSDIGYIKSLNALIISKTDSAGDTVLSLIKLYDDTVYFSNGAKGMLFPESIGVVAIRVKDNKIAVKYKNGECAVYGDVANLLVSRKKINGGTANNIDECVKILGSNMFAVSGACDANGASGYTSIYRGTTTGDLSSRGELVAYVKNPDDDLSYVKGFDNKYVSVVGNDTCSYMYSIPQNANGSPEKLTGGNGAITVDLDNEVQYSEITYFGNGRFFVYIDEKVESTDDYTYYDLQDYYSVKRYIYYANTDELKVYTDNHNKIFMSLTNTYYDSEKIGIEPSVYLKEGYTYASYGLNLFVNDDVTTGYYDQYILDSDLNIVMSLTGNYGENLTIDDREDITAFDLLMTCTDDVYYVPYMPSTVKYYDKNGNLLGSNNNYNVVAQSLSEGIAVAQIVDPDDEDSYLYGAFDTKGNVVIDFKYTSIASFRGFYTIGTRDDGTGKTVTVILGRDGKEYQTMSDLSTALSDMATTSAGTYIYKIGCYMFKETKNSTTYYGIKNFNPNTNKNTLLPASMLAGSTLYSPSNSTSDVFVFEKNTSTDNVVTYIIYKLK